MIALYARQSLDKKDSISIETQIHACRALCGDTNEEIRVFQDKGWSGKNIDRPAFIQMMDRVNQGNVSKVIVYRLDRLSRSIADFCGIWEKLDAHNSQFVSVNEHFDTSTPIGKAMLYIIMIFAQLERETIAERVKDNYYERIKSGSWPGGPAPYAMKNSSIIMPDGKKVPTIEATEEIETVKRIFHEYAKDGVTLGSICRILNSEGIPNAKSNTWSNVAVARVLHSPVYVRAGMATYRYYSSKGVKLSNSVEEFDGGHAAHLVGRRKASDRKYTKMEDHVLSLLNIEGVIDDDLFVNVQRKLEHNKQIKNSGAGKNTWLTGLIKCGYCHYAIVIRQWKETKYLGCSGHYNLNCCEHSRILTTLEELEKEVESCLEKEINSCKEEEISTTNTQEINKKMQDIEVKIQRLIDSIAQASAKTMQYINMEIDKLDEERKLYLNLLEQPSEQRSIQIKWSNSLSSNEKREIARAFIKKIFVFDDHVEIVWNF